MQNLSSREKFLMVVLAFLVINLIGLTYLITPGINYWRTAQSNCQTLNQEYDEKKMMVDNKDVYKAALDKLTAQYDASEHRFFTFASEGEMDAYLDRTLADISRQYSASFTLTDASQTTAGANVVVSRIELEASGSYDTLIAIVGRLQDSQDYISLSAWDLKAEKNYASSSWHLYAQLVMYRYAETGEAAAQ